jgi:hypothetical protein
MSKITQTETLLHKQAFEFYYASGEERSYKKTATKFKKSNQTIAVWARSFTWQDRVVVRDIDLGEELRGKTDRSIIEQREVYLDVIRELVDKFKTAVEEGAVHIDSVSDLDKLTKLDLLLSGSPTEILQVDTVSLEEKIRTMGRVDREALRKHILAGKNPMDFIGIDTDTTKAEA